MEELSNIWKKADKDIMEIPSELVFWDRIEQEISNPEPKGKKIEMFSGRMSWRVAASVIILLGISYLVTKLSDSFKKPADLTHVTVESGENRREVRLPDGSVIWLNKYSSVKYKKSFEGKNRGVILQGEGFFDVARNELKPFVVQAGTYLGKGIGTSFNIDAIDSGQKVTVSVTSGKVSVRNSRQRGVVLTRGEEVSYMKTQKKFIKRKLSPNFLSWKTGEFKFDNQELDQICTELSEYYDVEFEVKVGNKRRLTAHFQKEEFSEVLDVIVSTLGMNYRIDSTKVTIYQ